MKCQAGSKHKTPGSLLMQWSGRLLVRRSDLKATPPKSMGNSQAGQPLVGLVAICKPLHTTPVREIHMDGNMFIGTVLNIFDHFLLVLRTGLLYIMWYGPMHQEF